MNSFFLGMFMKWWLGTSPTPKFTYKPNDWLVLCSSHLTLSLMAHFSVSISIFLFQGNHPSSQRKLSRFWANRVEEKPLESLKPKRLYEIAIFSLKAFKNKKKLTVQQFFMFFCHRNFNNFLMLWKNVMKPNRGTLREGNWFN